MARRAGIAVATAASLMTAWLLWGTEIPLGIPGEWTWPRLRTDEATPWNTLVAIAAAAGYLAFIAICCRRLASETVGRIEPVAWPLALAVAGFAWLWVVQDTAPPAGQLAKAPFILYYPSSSGYFTKARYEARDVVPFLRDYEALMRQGDVLHVGTHPPGLFLIYHGLIALGERDPGLMTSLWGLAPESVREATAVVAENTRATQHPLTAADAALLWGTGLLVLALSAATVVPLYGLLRLSLPRDAAFLGAACWPAVPAVAMFWPKSDAAFPFVATLLTWAAFTGWTTGSRWRAAAAGLILFAGMFCSLAFLPVALFVALVVGHEAIIVLRQRQRTVPQVALWSACGFAGFLVPIGFCAWFGSLRMDRIWVSNYRNHAGFYGEYVRTYWQWLLVNPLELSIAFGGPLTVAAVMGAFSVGWAVPTQALQKMVGTAPPTKEGSLGRHAVWWGVAVWGLLWLTGKNSGEAARLWLLLMPGVVALAAYGLSFGQRDGSRGPRPILWLALQLGTMILTAHRIGGFHFEGL